MLELTEGLTGLYVQGGALPCMSGTSVGMATIAEDCLGIFLFPHSLSMGLAWASS